MSASTFRAVALAIVVMLAVVACGQSIDQPATVESPKVSAAGFSFDNALLGNAQGVSPSALDGQGEIHVTGQGAVAVNPDLAFLDISVETTSATVAEAREGTAVKMQAVMDVLEDADIEERDIQTRGFNVTTEYDYEQITLNGRVVGRSVIVGYTVRNSITVKIRDLDSVGTVIDDTAAAAENSISFNGPTFTVENLTSIADQLREAAVNDAKNQAQRYADLAGVGLGDLIYFSAGAISNPTSHSYYDYGYVAYAVAPPPALSTPTTISVGELTASLSVKAVFAIE